MTKLTTRQTVKLHDKTLSMKLTPFMVTGRAVPTEKNPAPKIYRMRIFARNAVVAKSRFWYFMKNLNKVKKTRGEILNVTTIRETNTHTVKNIGIWMRYDSRASTHNMYREYRDISICGAVGQMYMDMSSRHRALPQCIQIMRTAVIPDQLCRRQHVLQLLGQDVKFPKNRRRDAVPRERAVEWVAKH
ncbi:MAG: uncharacterized protein KVP18_004603 [Porospora cf. gigantea A]|uniref:uncharacterized protein n=1 Tax=Porospora cf. gigantea A TaxID=2853593 RepID=UPI00355A52C2|nr:MAG: hypothetical protein KVP18_004603 [Porospora cf. gigantea A]